VAALWTPLTPVLSSGEGWRRCGHRRRLYSRAAEVGASIGNRNCGEKYNRSILQSVPTLNRFPNDVPPAVNLLGRCFPLETMSGAIWFEIYIPVQLPGIGLRSIYTCTITRDWFEIYFSQGPTYPMVGPSGGYPGSRSCERLPSISPSTPACACWGCRRWVSRLG